MHKFKLDNRKMQEATGNAEPGGGQPAQQATTHAQGGAFANLMSRLGFGSNQQTANNQQQQPTAQPATNSQQQAPQQAAPLPSEFFGKLFTKQEPAQSNPKDPKEPPPNPWEVSPDTLTKTSGTVLTSATVSSNT